MTFIFMPYELQGDMNLAAEMLGHVFEYLGDRAHSVPIIDEQQAQGLHLWN